MGESATAKSDALTSSASARRMRRRAVRSDLTAQYPLRPNDDRTACVLITEADELRGGAAIAWVYLDGVDVSPRNSIVRSGRSHTRARHADAYAIDDQSILASLT